MSLERIENNKHLYKKLLTIAVPIALQGLIGSSLNFVDNLMVGSLGETELAAVGVSVQIFFIFWMLLFGFTSGCSTFFAQYWGAQDVDSIKKTTGFTITSCMAIGILFFIASAFFPEYVLRIFTDINEVIDIGKDYVRVGSGCFLFLAVTVPFSTALRATHQTHIPLYISVSSFTINTVLNYLLIFGHFGAPKLGVVGAALATVFSRGFECVTILIIVFVKKNVIAGTIKDYFGWNMVLVIKVLKNAIPTTINEGVWGMGTACYAAIYARTGVTQFAAVQASSTINQMFCLAAFSVGDAILILVGQKLGEGKLDEAYILAKKLLKIGIFVGFVAGLLLILISPPLIGLFGFTPAGARTAKLILLVFGITMALNVFDSMCITGVLRCGGDTKFAMICEGCTVWLIGVPIAAIMALVFELPIYIVVLFVKSEELVKGIILFKRFVSKKWVNNVVSD
ncbi:MAG: MATE family efflux transporter [Anaerovoracaceae bacterium]